MKQLLPDSAEGDLAAVCSWADEVRYNYHYRWSSPLHYIDTPDFKCNYEYCSKFEFLELLPDLKVLLLFYYLFRQLQGHELHKY